MGLCGIGYRQVPSLEEEYAEHAVRVALPLGASRQERESLPPLFSLSLICQPLLLVSSQYPDSAIPLLCIAFLVSFSLHLVRMGHHSHEPHSCT